MRDFVALLAVAATARVAQSATPVPTTSPAPTTSSYVDPSARSGGSVTLATGTFARLAQSSAGELFTLSKVAADGTETRAGRSYDGHGWEGAMPGALVFDCGGDGYGDDACSVWLTANDGDDDGDGGGAASYRCDTWSVGNVLTDEEELSRFLTQASFGPTRATLANLSAAAAALGGGSGGATATRAAAGAWVAAHVHGVPASLHRAHYRARANPRTPQAVVVGATRGACEVGSRWHRHAFTRADTGKTIDVAYVDGVYTLTVDSVARTEASTARFGSPTSREDA